MLTGHQKIRLARNEYFKDLVKVTLVGHCADVSHEVPAALTFGSEQAAVEATGRIAEAQLAMHDKRHAFAMEIMRNPAAYVDQAAMSVAATIVEELTPINAQLAAVVEGYGRQLIGDPFGLPLYDEEDTPNAPTMAQYAAMFEAAVKALIVQGFTAAAGYNTHTEPFR